MKIKRLPPGFVVPAQPIKASKPPSGVDWVHEIKHDDYRLIVRRDGPTVRLYTRNAYDWTARLPAIAAAAERIKAKSFTIDGEAVVLGPDGLSRFDDLRRREAARTAVLYAFDLIEHDGQDLRDHRFLDRKAALARLLRDTEAGILLNEHVAGMVLPFSRTLAGLVPRASSPNGWTAPIDLVRARSGSKSGILRASLCSGSAARTGTDDPVPGGENSSCSTGHAGRKERPTLSAGQILILRLLLAISPFFLFLGPFGLCPIPLLRCPFRDIVDLGRGRRCLCERYSRRDHANDCGGDERGSNK
jgi:bifunctional non-homologous end joining protein LigD